MFYCTIDRIYMYPFSRLAGRECLKLEINYTIILKVNAYLKLIW